MLHAAMSSASSTARFNHSIAIPLARSSWLNSECFPVRVAF